MRGFWRSTGRLFLASCLVLPAFAPLEHVHAADNHHADDDHADDHHAGVVVHRHAAPHQDNDHHGDGIVHQQVAPQHDEGTGDVSDHGEDVVWLKAVGVGRVEFAIGTAPATPSDSPPDAAPDRTSHPLPISCEASFPHGPPGPPPQLRAPPPFPPSLT